MSLRFALLGLLADQPASGYDLSQRFEHSLKRYAWHARHSQIYPELNKMTGDGLIEVAEEGPRGRRTYAITESGRRELREWLFHGSDERVVRNEFVLRVFLLSTLDDDDAARLLRAYADFAANERDSLRTNRDQARAESPPGQQRRFGHFAAEYGIRQWQAMHEWALWALEEFEQQPSSSASDSDGNSGNSESTASGPGTRP
jgi:PadR family transcriptional regulator, regulatory protein AphA